MVGGENEQSESGKRSRLWLLGVRVIEIFGLGNPSGSYEWKHSSESILLSGIGFLVFSVPAAVALVGIPSANAGIVAAIYATGLSLLVLIGLGLFALYTPRTGDTQANQPDQWPRVNLSSEAFVDTDHREETWLLEYQEVSEEARYRDQLLLRTTYFSLGIFALLVGVLSAADNLRLWPAIAAIGTLLSLVFTIAVNSYKDTRDSLWERQRSLERHPAFRDKLTVHHTVRTHGQRRLFNRLSLSSVTLTLHIFFVAIWILAYIGLIWLVVFHQ